MSYLCEYSLPKIYNKTFLIISCSWFAFFCCKTIINWHFMYVCEEMYIALGSGALLEMKRL